MSFNISSFSGKKLLILVAILYTIGLCAFLIHGAVKVVSPIVSYGEMTTMQVQETNSDTYCRTDTQCWCKSFDGERIGKETVHQTCNRAINRCETCVYK